MKTFLLVVGARPNFMKMAPICRAMDARDDCAYVLVHTGQHYDAKMSELFFDDLGLPRPAFDLGVHGGSHAQPTAAVMQRFEPVVEEVLPPAVVVVGDVNSTVACAMVAATNFLAGRPSFHRPTAGSTRSCSGRAAPFSLPAATKMVDFQAAHALS